MYYYFSYNTNNVDFYRSIDFVFKFLYYVSINVNKLVTE